MQYRVLSDKRTRKETKMKWTDEKVIEVVDECRKAAKSAAQDKLNELCLKYGKPPTYIHPEYGRCASMLGMCGGAWVVIGARSGFYRAAKKLSQERRHLRFSCRKGYPKNGTFNVYDTHSRQELEVDEAAAHAIKDVLDSHDIPTKWVHTYID